MTTFRIAPWMLPLALACASTAQAADGGAIAAESADVQETLNSMALAAVQSSDSPSAPKRAETPAPPRNKWEFAAVGYVFLAGAYGRTTPRDSLPPVDLHLSFGDVWKAFKFAFMGAAEARNDRLLFLGDLMWVHLGESQGLKVRDVNFANVKIDSKTTAITALGGYRLLDNGPVAVDLLAGGRLNGNKQEVDYQGRVRDLSGRVSKTWIDPILATRINVPVGSKFGLSLYGDVGGFGIGSKLTWQGVATASYQINRKIAVGAGWRYFKIDYKDNDGFLFDVAQSGPILTLRTVF